MSSYIAGHASPPFAAARAGRRSKSPDTAQTPYPHELTDVAAGNHTHAAPKLDDLATPAKIRALRFLAEAKADGIDGLVTVDLLITPEGYVQEAQVVTESPAGAGFGLAALDVVKTWEFNNDLKRLVLLLVSVPFLP